MVRSAERRCRNAKVYFRCAPGASRDFVRVLADARTVYVRCLQDFLAGGLDAAPNYWCFETDGVFCNDSQRDIYETVMPDVLRRFLGGENAAVIAYGATGTGKSLTIGGVEKSFEDRGLVFRALERLMALREEARGKMEVTYTMSFVEASNSQVYDLLDENVPAYGSASMKRLSKVVVDDLQTGLEEIFKGEGRRTTSKKTLHDSHALHSVLTIAARCRLKDETRPLQAVSKLHFVDLAGVDTVGNEGSFHKGVAEIGMANVTKAQVEQFVLALIENVTENVSVKRNLNILILYLGDALSHSSQLRLIGHIRTGRRDLMMTLSMLRLGNLVRGLKGKRAVPDFKETEEGKIRHLEKVVKAMRQEMEIQSMISNDGLSRNLTQDRLGHLQRLAEGYLSNKISELVVVSFSDVGTVLNVFKDRFLDLEAKRKEEVDAAYDRALQSLKSSNPAVAQKTAYHEIEGQRYAEPVVEGQQAVVVLEGLQVERGLERQNQEGGDEGHRQTGVVRQKVTVRVNGGPKVRKAGTEGGAEVAQEVERRVRRQRRNAGGPRPPPSGRRARVRTGLEGVRGRREVRLRETKIAARRRREGRKGHERQVPDRGAERWGREADCRVCEGRPEAGRNGARNSRRRRREGRRGRPQTDGARRGGAAGGPAAPPVRAAPPAGGLQADAEVDRRALREVLPREL